VRNDHDCSQSLSTESAISAFPLVGGLGGFSLARKKPGVQIPLTSTSCWLLFQRTYSVADLLTESRGLLA
jgi:hypothetical protein